MKLGQASNTEKRVFISDNIGGLHADNFRNKCFCTGQVRQNQNYGTVYDETKQPLAGASVREERTSNETIARPRREFLIYVKKGSTIRISFLGLESKVMTANIAGKFDIMLKDNTKELGGVRCGDGIRENN